MANDKCRPVTTYFRIGLAVGIGIGIIATLIVGRFMGWLTF
jgi:hypothetical protein